MLPLFRAVVKFCSTNRLFTNFIFIRLKISLSASVRQLCTNVHVLLMRLFHCIPLISHFHLFTRVRTEPGKHGYFGKYAIFTKVWKTWNNQGIFYNFYPSQGKSGKATYLVSMSFSLASEMTVRKVVALIFVSKCELYDSSLWK